MGDILNKGLISVIIPVYNSALYLRECLDSVCNQTYKNLEIICVNDGSTDGSLGILQEYAAKDERIHVISQENRGVAYTRNIGLSVAQGEWLTWADSDDWLESDAYEKVMTIAAPNLDLICYGGKIEGDIDSKTKEILQNYNDLKFQGRLQMAPSIADSLDVYLWNKFIRRDLVTTHAVSFPNGRIYEDAAFLYCLFPFICSCYFIPERLYHYRQHASSIMDETRKITQKGIDHLHVIRYIREFYATSVVKDEWWGFIRRKFTNYYRLTIKYTPMECRNEVSLLARDIANELNAEIPYLPFLNRRTPLFPESVFHSYHNNCESFGIGKFHIFSIVYTRKEKSFYFMGKRVLTILNNTNTSGK